MWNIVLRVSYKDGRVEYKRETDSAPDINYWESYYDSEDVNSCTCVNAFYVEREQ